MIKELTKKTLGKSKSGWLWDRKREVFFTFQIDTQFNGERFIKRGFRSEESAKDYIENLKTQERLKEIGFSMPVKFPTAKEAFDKHLENLDSNAERIRAKRVYEAFLDILPKNARIDDIRRDHFKKFSAAKLKTGVKADTVRRDITPIVSALRAARDYFPALDKWIPPPSYRPPSDGIERDRIVEKDEREKVLKFLLTDRTAGERSKDFISRRRTGLVWYFTLLTGLRPGEIYALRKTEFSRSAKRLRAERLKTKRKGVRWTVFEPLTVSQIWVLTEAAELYPDSPFFFSTDGKPYNKVYSIFQNACKALGVPYGRKTLNGMIPYDARHTFVTTLETGGIDTSTTRGFSGHSKDTMLKRYAHSTFTSRARAMNVIEQEMSIIGGNGETSEKLMKIYADVRSGELSFEDFAEIMKDSFTVF